jgi:hypothetical protein
MMNRKMRKGNTHASSTAAAPVRALDRKCAMPSCVSGSRKALACAYSSLHAVFLPPRRGLPPSGDDWSARFAKPPRPRFASPPPPQAAEATQNSTKGCDFAMPLACQSSLYRDKPGGGGTEQIQHEVPSRFHTEIGKSFRGRQRVPLERRPLISSFEIG